MKTLLLILSAYFISVIICKPIISKYIKDKEDVFSSFTWLYTYDFIANVLSLVPIINVFLVFVIIGEYLKQKWLKLTVLFLLWKIKRRSKDKNASDALDEVIKLIKNDM